MGRARSNRRRVPPGPLAAWRFAASVLAALLLVGGSLLDATGPDQLERMVAMGAAFGLVVWIALGVIDRAIAVARVRGPRMPEPAAQSTRGGHDAS